MKIPIIFWSSTVFAGDIETGHFPPIRREMAVDAPHFVCKIVTHPVSEISAWQEFNW